MKILRTILSILLIGAMGVLPAAAQLYPSEYEQFVRNNPDGNKYEFVKDYIMALEYVRLNDQKYQKWVLLSSYQEKDASKLKGYIDHLKQSNINFRIAKNLLKKHAASRNGLMLKTLEIFEEACNEMVLWNNKEREIMTGYYQALVDDNAENYDIEKLTEEQQRIVYQRKESYRKILDSAMHAKRVLISNVPNKYGEFVRLGITEDERWQLVKRIETGFQVDERQGVQQGQTFLEASITVIRDILEDRAWLSQDT